MLREGEIGVKPDTEVPNRVSWPQEISKDIDWKEFIEVCALCLGAKDDKFSLVRIQLEFVCRHP